MAIDINAELKKSTEKTNVYKTYNEYKKDYDKLKKNGINGRRYFYPLITEFPMYQNKNKNLINAKKISEKIICLPIYSEMDKRNINLILDIIKS
mgnify:CR=1 FL=1